MAMRRAVRVGLLFRWVLRRCPVELFIRRQSATREGRVKAFLLAAGQGTRLRPLTDRVPKCLVPIRDVPVLGIWLELCRRFGIDEVLINLHSHAELVQEYVRNNGSDVKV